MIDVTIPRPTKGLTEQEIWADQSADLTRAFLAGKRAGAHDWRPIALTLLVLLAIVSAAAVLL